LSLSHGEDVTASGVARAHHSAAIGRHERDESSIMPAVVEAHETHTGTPARLDAVRGLLHRVRDRVDAWVSDPGLALPALLLLAFVLRAAWIDKPPGSLIFDEAYYVNASRVILGLPVAEGEHYAGSPAGLDPNIEHPPLGKVLIAGSMAIFGDGPLGWRLPSIIAALIAIAAVYLIVRAVGETAALALGIAGFVAFDNLMLVHGRIATLDMLALAPILVGAWLAIRERWLLAGALVGLGFLVKLSALYGLLAIGALLALRAIGRWRDERGFPMVDARSAASLVVGVAVVGLVGLWLLDLRFTTFTSPLDHVRHMVEYGASLKEPVTRSGICSGATSAPWQWLFNECEINYLSVDSIVREGETIVAQTPAILFRGAMNPVLMAPLGLALLVSLGVAWRTGHRMATWAIVWGLANWLPYVLLVLVSHRVTYIFYFLPVVPAAAAALAVLLWRSTLPRWIGGVYSVAYVIGFVAYFPFRQLP
jgi:dolichyl-phosphate-mannose-protein mannosyltransferase